MIGLPWVRGTAERVFVQIERVVAERGSVDRSLPPLASEPSDAELPVAAVAPHPAA